MLYDDDTIAAISTAKGTGSIGIIRISGNSAFEIAEKIFSGKRSFNEIKSHTINYGKIVDPVLLDTVDEVLLSKMVGPNTFTCEDIVEINCHGGMVVLKKILEIVIKEGARLAGPGEFTKRAFLNGRIDLSQAEAVMDIINSKADVSFKVAVDQLEGKLSKRLQQVRNKIIELIANIEVNIDYPEYDVEEITAQRVYNSIIDIKNVLQGMVKNFEKGRIMREGVSVAIVGKPNVGKSSLLNELLGKNRAIVTDIPGTTRDIIEEYIDMGGIPVRIMDTAGIRKTEDVIERMGIEKTNKVVEVADIVIMLIDAGDGFREDDAEILEGIRLYPNKKIIVLANKIDIVGERDLLNLKSKLSTDRVIETSVKEGVGIDELERVLTESFLFGEVSTDSDVIITSIRHKDLIESGLRSICEAIDALKSGVPLDCITVDIRNSAEYLGEITGESISEDVINQIFNNFCIGK